MAVAAGTYGSGDATGAIGCLAGREIRKPGDGTRITPARSGAPTPAPTAMPESYLVLAFNASARPEEAASEGWIAMAF